MGPIQQFQPSEEPNGESSGDETGKEVQWDDPDLQEING
jgi:hypothetical protein